MELRVLDFGRVSPIRSQSLWHAIAYGVSSGAPPTLSFMVPESPYVSIGYHVDTSAVNLDACTAAGLPVLRRMVGGGPVYLDEDQLFFQITVPVSMTSAMRTRAVHDLLSPAVDAFRAAGIPARLDPANEIVIDDQKICGHAAGQIGDAVIVVGNLITGFDHDAAAAIAQTPNPLAAEMFRRFLGRYVTAVQADSEMFMRAAIASYARALDLRAPDRMDLKRSHNGDLLAELSTFEREKLLELDDRLGEESFVAGEPGGTSMPWRVKVKSDVWVYGHENGRATAVLGLVDDVITHVKIDVNGYETSKLEERLVGAPIACAAERLRGGGTSGAEIAKLVEAMAKGSA